MREGKVKNKKRCRKPTLAGYIGRTTGSSTNTYSSKQYRKECQAGIFTAPAVPTPPVLFCVVFSYTPCRVFPHKLLRWISHPCAAGDLNTLCKVHLQHFPGCHSFRAFSLRSIQQFQFVGENQLSRRYFHVRLQ